MTHRNVSSAAIARPIADVFDWVTTPAHWPEYWPTTMAIEGAEPRVR